jgi:hypothetical protein
MTASVSPPPEPTARPAALARFTTQLTVDRRARQNVYFVVLALVLLVVFPLLFDIFRLNLLMEVKD